MRMSSIKRKISTGPELQPIFENENEVERFEDNLISPTTAVQQTAVPKKQDRGETSHQNTPPQVPSKNTAVEEQINYVNDTLLWLRSELADLKQEDKNLMHFYKSVMTTVGNLKRVTINFKEQSMEKTSDNKKETPAACEFPLEQNNIDSCYRRIAVHDSIYSYS